jgi:3-hydroxyisobutyrate dehydrogenase-like beta-hydroxyacid dehydrogenase
MCKVRSAVARLLPRKVKKGTLLIDSSTIDPAVSREMAIAAEKMGAVFMDAPVSGGTSGFRFLRYKISHFTYVLMSLYTIYIC